MFRVAIFAGCLAGLASVAGWAQAQTPRPNIVLIMADDLGWGDVGYNGNTVIRTPHLDRMAAEGARFDRFYAAAPVCSPTRASCLTGRHPFRSGVFGANTGMLRAEEVTIAEVLKAEGYATGHFGKWHLGTFTSTMRDSNRGGPDNPQLVNPPTRHGFDTYFSTEAKVPTWDPMKRPARFDESLGESRRFGWRALQASQPAEVYGTSYWSPDGRVSDDLEGCDSRLIMDHAVEFIRDARDSGKPFLAVIWFHAPHLPCVAGPEYAAMYEDHDFKMQQFAGCITALDEQVGRLRKTLSDLQIDQNTMVCFTSDNGPENGTPGSTGGLRDRKRSLHEGGIRVPGLVVWPAVVRKPIIITAPCVTSDYLPTVLNALGKDIDKHPLPLDGASLLPLLRGETKTMRRRIAFVSGRQMALMGPALKLYGRGNQPDALFDITVDKTERNDLSAAAANRLSALQSELDAWLESCRASFEGKDYGTPWNDQLNQTFPSWIK